MTDNKRRPPDDQQPQDPMDRPNVEEEAAVEWGERIDTGKTIARGGKEEGEEVPGATDQSSK